MDMSSDQGIIGILAIRTTKETSMFTLNGPSANVVLTVTLTFIRSVLFGLRRPKHPNSYKDMEVRKGALRKIQPISTKPILSAALLSKRVCTGSWRNHGIQAVAIGFNFYQSPAIRAGVSKRFIAGFRVFWGMGLRVEELGVLSVG